MLETILLAMIIARIKGYKLKPLLNAWAVYPVLVFILIYIGLQITVFCGNYSLIKYSRGFETVYLASFLILIMKYKKYTSAIAGSVFAFAGTALNKMAIAANGGKMPVFPTLSYLTGYAKPDVFSNVDNIHALGTSAVKLKFLTDYIDLGYSILSIGDVLIRFFTFIIFFAVIKEINISKDKIL